MIYTADRVKETTTTTGTGTLSLGGAVVNFITFVTGVGTGNQCYYCIEDNINNVWEVGIGTVTAGTPDTLSRDTILASSNSGSVISLSSGTKNVFITSPNYLQRAITPKISAFQNWPIEAVNGFIVEKIGTTLNGTKGIGSSLFLKRVTIPAVINISEVDVLFNLNFPGTSLGGGSISRSFVVYSFGNSTSLASVMSFSNSSSWNSGTSTAGGSASITQFQAGWGGLGASSMGIIQPMTFNSSSLAPGEYVIGNLIDFSQVSSNWSFTLLGLIGGFPSRNTFASNIGTTGAGALGSGGLLAASAFTATSSSSLTAWTAAPTNINVLSSNGLNSFGSVHFLSHTNMTGGKTIGASATNGALSGLSSAITMTMVTSFSSGSYLTASGSGAGFSNAGTGGFGGFMGSGGLIAGSFLTSNASVNAITSVALTLFNASYLTNQPGMNFQYYGTISTSAFPNNTDFPFFNNGLMSTGAIPANISLTSTAVTKHGTAANMQPWFALIGA